MSTDYTDLKKRIGPRIKRKDRSTNYTLVRRNEMKEEIFTNYKEQIANFILKIRHQFVLIRAISGQKKERRSPRITLIFTNYMLLNRKSYFLNQTSIRVNS